MDEPVGGGSSGRIRLRALPLAALAVAVAALPACTAPDGPVPVPPPSRSASPAVSTPPPAVREPGCPSAARVAAATGLPFTRRVSTRTACSYTVAHGAGTRVVVRRPATPGLPRNGTLSAARQDVAADPSVLAVADAPGLAVPAFTVRYRDRTCATWTYAADGLIQSITARRTGGRGGATCALARAAAALVGSVPVAPQGSATQTVAVIAPGPLLRPVIGAPAWTSQVATAARVRVEADPASGLGFLPSAASSATFVEAARRVDAASAAVVFVSGDADAAAPRLDVARAAGFAFDAATSAAPGARLVVVGPVDAGGDPTPRTYDLRTALRAAARIAGAAFIDPIELGWSAGKVPRGTFSGRESAALAAGVEAALRADVLCRDPGEDPRTDCRTG